MEANKRRKAKRIREKEKRFQKKVKEKKKTKSKERRIKESLARNGAKAKCKTPKDRPEK